jgi:hypothetical protein
VVAGGAGVVGDGLRIGAELVEAAAGQSEAGGGGARGGAHGGSGGGDLEAQAGGGGWTRRRLGVREATGDPCTTLGGGGWTRRSPEWAGDGEAPSTEEADDDGIGSLQGVAWQLAARRQGTARGVEVGDDEAAPVTLVEVVRRQQQRQAEQRSG